MFELLEIGLPWLLSALTLISLYLAGDRNPMGWLVGLINQALWLVWILLTQTWGLLPMNLTLWLVFTRNYFKWRSGDV